MARYVDGFIIPIKKKNLKKYEKMAALGKRVWMQHGALDYYECVGDDLKIPIPMTFTKLCKLKPDETVIFAYIVYKSKAHRDRVNSKVMADPRMNPEHHEELFNLKRFSMGGFKAIVHS